MSKDFPGGEPKEFSPAAPIIILAGATGQLGQLLARYLIQGGATVRALVRPHSSRQTTSHLRILGASVVEVDFYNASSLRQACSGGACVVSALSGLREVIVEAQTRLLEAAGAAGVPRFIPSDYCIDFTKLTPGSNRNLDLRREFAERLHQSPIAATSILNGMFTDLLTGQAPLLLFGLKRVIYWGKADQPLDFTTLEDTARFTALVALDASSPRFLRIAGQVMTIRELKQTAGQVTGKPFRLLRLGGLGTLATMINVTRTIIPGKGDVFPPWQGMQYLHNMLSGLPKLAPLDNDRYPHFRWTPVRDVLAARPTS